MILPVILVGSGAAILLAMLFSKGEERPDRDYEPDVVPPPPPPPPGRMPESTGFRGVDEILGQLRQASMSSGIPLGLLVGWTAKESSGRVGAIPKTKIKRETDFERGLFQLSPTESRALGVDHARLSTDVTYSINAGLALIGRYMGVADKLGVAQRGSPYYWRLPKLIHSMGQGQVQKIVKSAKSAGQAGSWEALREHALDMKLDGPQPKKWFAHADAVYKIGKPFGFGGGEAVVGGDVVSSLPYPDIPDPLDVIQPRA